jgi:hypothetical protein
MLLPASNQAQKEHVSRLKSEAAVLELIERAKGPVLSEDMLLLVKAGKEVPAEPAIIQELASSGIWDERPLIRMIEENRFPIIVAEDIADRQRYTATVAAAITRAYSQTRDIGYFRIYEPHR